MTFGRSFTSDDPSIFPSDDSDVFWRYIIAAFWADLNTLGDGSVSWEVHNSSLSSTLVNKVNSLIQVEYGDANFTGSWMIVGFWENVTDANSTYKVS